jgi:hypothetical protein
VSGLHEAPSDAAADFEVPTEREADWRFTPLRGLLRPGQVVAAARRVPGAAHVLTGELDAGEALARRDWMTAGWDDKDQVQWLAGAGATLVRALAGSRASGAWR